MVIKCNIVNLGSARCPKFLLPCPIENLRSPISMENHSTGFWAAWILLLVGASNASIHEYKNEKFIPQANARFFHGGSEGLYASNSQDLNTSSSSPDISLKGKSFIRSINQSLSSSPLQIVSFFQV